ncbi:hypothetical protein [Lacisediminihabitans sp. H27-G8]|uniref:hypothetical protein n=1 Tax=Lacisediminihabitans sp. H27-G8 TaxID=3111909 RepID=UPI0038FC2072
MRFIAAIISFVIAFGLIAYGIAQRTVLAEADSITASETFTTKAPVTIVNSSTLKSLPGRQEIHVSGAKKIFAAYGRTDDVLAWVGDASYNRVGFNSAKSTLTSRLVEGKTSQVPNPQGSDLWLDQFSETDSLDFTVNVPDNISVIIVSDGTSAAPSTLSIRWPLDNRTPWSGPLIVGGIVLLIVGLALYLWGLAHLRRSRGPRRKTPKMPKVPRQRSYRPRKPKALAPTGSRRSNRRRMVAIVPVLLIGGLTLSGCTPDSWPDFGPGAASATPTPSATAAAADVSPPAVTVPQLRVILARISAVAAKADADKDVDLAKTRFDGAALDLRAANYAIRKVDDTQAALAAIPASSATVILPQLQDAGKWPRVVFTVVQNPTDKKVPPVGLMLEQKTPRSDYKVEYATALEAGVVLPKLAAKEVGAPRLDPDVKLLELAPSKIALAYGDILEKGPTSESAKYFDTSNDKLIGLIGLEYRKSLQAALPATAKMEFANSVGTYDSISLGSNDSGAIVAVNLNETVTVTPVEAGAAVNPEGQVKSLSGVTGSTKGTVAVYSDQLLFYVPSSTSKEKISLLGFATGLTSAKELP